MGIIFEIMDKNGRKISLSQKRYKHLQKYPHMHDSIENIKTTLEKPTTVRYKEEDETVSFFYKEFKHNDSSEKYLLVSVKYLNDEGFVITAFYTNKITGTKWKI